MEVLGKGFAYISVGLFGLLILGSLIGQAYESWKKESIHFPAYVVAVLSGALTFIGSLITYTSDHGKYEIVGWLGLTSIISGSVGWVIERCYKWKRK